MDGTRASPDRSWTPPSARDASSIPELFRDATDSFVELVAAHIKLTNLELIADLEARARLVVMQVVVGIVGLVGYGLVMVALGLAAGAFMSPWAGFLALGAIHLVGAGIAALVLSRRRRRALLVERAIDSLGKSVTVVADAVLGPTGQTNARS